MKIESLKNKYVGKRCFIVATGPSLAYKKADFLKNEFTIGVNLSPLMFDLWGFQPTFNIVADKYIFPYHEAVLKELIVGTETIKIGVASAAETYPETLIDENTIFSEIKLDQDLISFSKDPFKDGFTRGKTVTFDAIQLAYYLGFSEVYVLGMDMTTNHDWGLNGHCYEIQKNPRFSDIDFFKTESSVIQRGLPGNPQYRDFIEKLMAHANSIFEETGRKIFIDSSSSLKSLSKKDVFKEFSVNPKVAAVVPVKGSSNRVPGKNIKLLDNKPLFLHIVDTLLQCSTIDEIYVDTESDDIFSLIGTRPIKRIIRPIDLASNKTDGNSLLLFEASQIDADIIVQSLATGPFLSIRTINESIFKLISEDKYDSVFTVRKSKEYLWKTESIPTYNIDSIPNSVDLPDTIVEVMNFYAIWKDILLKINRRIGNSPYLKDVSFIESIDIDTPEDFEFAEIVCQGLKKVRK